MLFSEVVLNRRGGRDLGSFRHSLGVLIVGKRAGKKCSFESTLYPQRDG